MRTFIFGMLATIGLSDFSKADVVLSNSADGTNASSASTMSIKFTTTGTSNRLTSLNLNLISGTLSDTVGWTLTTGVGGGTTIDQGVNATIVNGALDLSGSALFGAGDFWFTVSNIEFANYIRASAVTLNSSDGAFVSGASFVTGNGSVTNVATINSTYYGTLGVAVPEPGTMLLGGIAAVGCGGGVWWKRRRKWSINSTSTESVAN